MTLGIYRLNRTSLDKEYVTLAFDFSTRHEIVAGATVASATARALLADAATSDFTAGSPTVNTAGTVVSIPIRDVSTTVGNAYSLVCVATLSNGEVLVESVTLDPAQA